MPTLLDQIVYNTISIRPNPIPSFIFIKTSKKIAKQACYANSIKNLSSLLFLPYFFILKIEVWTKDQETLWGSCLYPSLPLVNGPHLSETMTVKWYLTNFTSDDPSSQSWIK